MKKPYLLSIEYIRGVAMLGVIAIHIGAFYIFRNSTPNFELVTIFSVLSRFSVPIFFFISAFGLFYKINLNEPFDYVKFLRRRFKAVLLPYLIWSVIYVIHHDFFYDSGIPAPSYALEILFFGLAKYHLYFMVILIWFYVLMPIWIKIIKNLTPLNFAAIFFAQIGFNYFSGSSEWLFQFQNSLSEDSILKLFLIWRTNYLVLHYTFIFLLGGILAVHSQRFFDWISENKKIISTTFFTIAIVYVGYFYFLIYTKNFDFVAAVNTAQQLSTIGFLYSVIASIFFFMLFESCKIEKNIQSVLSVLGKNSYFIYLFHPLWGDYLIRGVEKFGLVVNAKVAIISYLLTVLISLFVSLVWKKISWS